MEAILLGRLSLSVTCLPWISGDAATTTGKPS